MIAKYTYDAYGMVYPHAIDDNPFSVLASVLFIVFNPLLYRGYVYTFAGNGFSYYLGSRFYDPQLGRFLNADSHTDTGTGVNGTNMFVYYNNNPVVLTDPTGEDATVKEEQQPLGLPGLIVAIVAIFVAIQIWLNPPSVPAPDISITKTDIQAKADAEIKNKVKKHRVKNIGKLI